MESNKMITVSSEDIHRLVVETVLEVADTPMHFLTIDGFDPVTCVRLSDEIRKVANRLAEIYGITGV